jgi:branched-chain amino acid transport system substrate-binding protein
MEIGVMMHKLDRRAFCFAMGLIGLGAGSIDAWAEDGAIRLGIVAPMSGPNSRYGSYSLRGAQLAAEEINSAGGIGGPRSDQSGRRQGASQGVSATRRLIGLKGVVSSSATYRAR